MDRRALEELGLTKEQIDGVCDLNSADLKPLQEKLQKAEDDLKLADGKVTTMEDKLKEFAGVDPVALNKQIEDLKDELKKKDTEHQEQMAERDFQDMLKAQIASAKGRNAKAITALLDVETLKASKNQEKDIAAALKELAGAEDSKMLFGEPEPVLVGTGNPIGTVFKSEDSAQEAQMRSVMGLPPVAEQK